MTKKANVKRFTPPEELELFRGAKSAFFRDSDFGEVRFFKDGESPRMEHGEGLPWDACEWFAEEADGAVIGYLRLDGVDLAHAPVAWITNEGSFEVTGLSIVDHFALATSVAGDEVMLKPLLDFCRKQNLPGPRDAATVKKAIAKAKLRNIEKKILKVDARAWIDLVDSTKPAPPAAAVKAPTKKAAPGTVVLSEYAYGCASPDGPIVALGEHKKILYRLVDDQLQLVSKAPINAMQIAVLGDVIFAAEWVGPAAVFRDGEWTDLKVPKAELGYRGHPYFVGDGNNALYYVSDTGALHAWDGKAFALLEHFPPRKDVTAHALSDGSLCLVGGTDKSNDRVPDVTLVTKERSVALPKLENEFSKTCVAGDVLVAFADDAFSTLSLTDRAAKWKGSFTLERVQKSDFDKDLIGLTNGKVLLRCLRRALYSFDPSTGKSAAAGEQRLEPHGSQSALPTSDGGVLLIGGSLGVRKKGDAPLQPQIWRAGKITSLAGAEKDLEAQVKLQRPG